MDLTRYGEAANGNQLQNIASFRYDERDLIFRTSRGFGFVTLTDEYNYDGNGNLVEHLQGLEDTPRQTLYVYDAYNRAVSETDAMGNISTYSYDANSNVVSDVARGELNDIPDSMGNVRLSETNSRYDDMDRLTRQDEHFFDTASQAPIGDGLSTTTYDYNDNSQVERVTDDNGHVTLLRYDSANRLARRTDPAGNSREYFYDENSNVVGIQETDVSTDPRIPAETFVETFTYDNLDRLASEV